MNADQEGAVWTFEERDDLLDFLAAMPGPDLIDRRPMQRFSIQRCKAFRGSYGGHYSSLRGTPQLTLLINYELFEELTGLPLNTHTAHELTHAVAKGLTMLNVASIRQAIVAKIAAVAAGQTRPRGLHLTAGARGRGQHRPDHRRPGRDASA